MAKERTTNEYFEDNGIHYLKVVNTKSEQIYFIIDAEDLTNVSKHKWNACYDPSIRGHYLENECKIKYHRYVMNTPPELVVDHINRCTYDNRKHNLRNCTVAENTRNVRRPKFQTNPKQGKTGLKYISAKYYINKLYYDVRYHNYKRRYFKTIEEAKIYLEQLIQLEKQEKL